MLNSNDDTNDFLQRSFQRLIAKHFTGTNDVILNRLFTYLPLDNILSQVQRDYPGIEQTDIENVNADFAKQINIVQIFQQFDTIERPEFLDEYTEEQALEFGNALSAFTKEFVHMVFTYIAIENQSIAPNIQGFCKEIFSTLSAANPEMGEFFNQVDIDNVPVRSSFELFKKSGGLLGFTGDPAYTVEPSPAELEEENTEVDTRDVPHRLICALTEKEAIFIAYNLQYEHDALKDWKSLVLTLMTPNGKNILVNPSKKKIGLLLSVLKYLYQKRTPDLGLRYLRTDKGNGLWTFFQGFLVTAPNTLVEGDLRKLFSQYKDMETAQKIVEEALDPKNKDKVNERANEYNKKLKQ